MIKKLIAFLVIQIFSIIILKGTIINDSTVINLPSVLEDTIEYSYRLLDEERLAIFDFEKQHIIISNIDGNILNTIRCTELKGRFKRTYTNIGFVEFIDNQLLILFRSDINNFIIRTSNVYFLIKYDLSTNEYSINRCNLKLNGAKYKLPHSHYEVGDFYYDSKNKLYYFPLALERGNNRSRSNCNEIFKRSQKVGVLDKNGELVDVFGNYSPLYTQHPCLTYFGKFSMTMNDDKGELAIQEPANPNLHLYNLENRNLKAPFDTLDLNLPLIKSYYDRLVNGVHYIMTQDSYGTLTYDSVNEVYYRFYRPGIEDTTSQDKEYEQLLKQYLNMEIKVCPSVSTQKQAQLKMLREAPIYYQVFGKDGEMINSIKIPEHIELEAYYKPPEIFYFDKGSIWIAETKNWVEKGCFKLFRLKLSEQ